MCKEIEDQDMSFTKWPVSEISGGGNGAGDSLLPNKPLMQGPIKREEEKQLVSVIASFMLFIINQVS